MYKIEQLNFTISNVLLKIGVSYKLDGAKYLARAVDIAINTPNSIITLTKNIYSVIAQEFGTKPANVERSIRHAVKKACASNCIEHLNQIFGINLYSQYERPSNGELIAILAERIPYLTSHYVKIGAC